MFSNVVQASVFADDGDMKDNPLETTRTIVPIESNVPTENALTLDGWLANIAVTTPVHT